MEATIEENQIIGAGIAELPVLAFQLALHIRYPFKQAEFGLELRELRCRLRLQNGSYLAANYAHSGYLCSRNA